MEVAGGSIDGGRTVVLSAGDFPAPGGRQDRILRAARRVVCCDSAADSYFEAFGREPDAVVGDCDSVRRAYANLVRIAEQDTNEKGAYQGVQHRACHRESKTPAPL